MKSIIVALALAASVCAVDANADSKTELCLAYGSMAEIVSEMFASGTSIKRVNQIAELHGGENVREYKQIINYIYTLDLDPRRARKLVYLKCQAGSYD